MPKSDCFPELRPQLKPTNLRGLTLHELQDRQERNTRNMALLKRWLDDVQDPVIHKTWKEFDDLRKRLNRAIFIKRLKIRLLSLVGRN